MRLRIALTLSALWLAIPIFGQVQPPTRHYQIDRSNLTLFPPPNFYMNVHFTDRLAEANTWDKSNIRIVTSPDHLLQIASVGRLLGSRKALQIVFAGSPPTDVTDAKICFHSLTFLDAQGENHDASEVCDSLDVELFEHLNRPIIVTQSASGVTRHDLPFRGSVSSDGSHVHLGVVVDVEGGGMRPSPNASSFVGKLLFGIIDTKKPDSQQTLPTPVKVQVTADVDNIAPDAAFSLDHTNLPFVPVTLSAASPQDTVSVQIRLSFSPADPVRVDVNVIRPELSIEASPKKIQGWGLEEADITVRTTNMGQPEGTEVTWIRPKVD